MPFISSFGGNYSSIGRGGPKFNNAIGGTTTEVSNYLGTGETWRIHQVSSNINFQITSGVNPLRVLLIAGGGGKGSTDGNAGGGGGGGYVEVDQLLLTPGLYSVVVGLAGNDDQNGENTIAFGLTALGGGYGGKSMGGTAFPGNSGGCGGGGGGMRQGAGNLSGGAGSQGGNGGSGFNDTGTLVGGGGGGGGAGGNGSNGTAAGNGGSGGIGRSFDITGTSVTACSGGKGGQGAAGGNGWQGRNGIVIVAYRIR